MHAARNVCRDLTIDTMSYTRSLESTVLHMLSPVPLTDL